MTKQTYPPRRGKPFTRYLRNDPQAGIVRLFADDDGRVTITSDAEQRVADALGLPTVKAAPSTKESD
jgi:hypothetical protein